MSVHAHQAYRQTQVATASQGELLIMMFDGAIRFARQAKEHLLASELEQANSKLIRSQDIVNELSYSLNLDAGDIALNLERLYDYIYDLLVQANINKDPEKIDSALQMLDELRGTWAQVVS